MQASFHTFYSLSLTFHPVGSGERERVENCNSVSFQLVRYYEFSFYMVVLHTEL